MTLATFIQLILLLLVANGAPVLATFFFGRRGALPLDQGQVLRDGQPLFGTSKTWRGAAAAVVATGMVAWLLGYAPGFGLVFGALAMSGDLVSSFIKRRWGLQPGTRCPVLDQLPEALLPAIYALFSLQIQWWWAIILAITFMLTQIAISRPLYRLRIRKHPH